MMRGDNMPLGFSHSDIYRQASRPLESGDLFLFYTDGITEAEDEAGDQFGLERLVALVQEIGPLAPDLVVARIHEAVQEFADSDSFADDMTCLAVKISEIESRK